MDRKKSQCINKEKKKKKKRNLYKKKKKKSVKEASKFVAKVRREAIRTWNARGAVVVVVVVCSCGDADAYPSRNRKMLNQTFGKPAS